MTETLDRPPTRARSAGARRRQAVDVRLLGLTGVLVLLCLIGFITNPDTFLTQDNISDRKSVV